MNQEERRILEETLKISLENKELLLKIRNFQKWSQITRAFYWVLIIAISLGAFYFIKPYFGNLLNVYSGDVSGIKSLNSLTGGKIDGSQTIKDLLNQLNSN